MDLEHWFLTLGFGGISMVGIWSILDPLNHGFPACAALAGCCLLASAIVIAIVIEVGSRLRSRHKNEQPPAS